MMKRKLSNIFFAWMIIEGTWIWKFKPCQDPWQLPISEVPYQLAICSEVIRQDKVSENYKNFNTREDAERFMKENLKDSQTSRFRVEKQPNKK